MSKPKQQLSSLQCERFARMVVEAGKIPAVPPPVTVVEKNEHARAVAVLHRCDLGCPGSEYCKCQDVVLTNAETELLRMYNGRREKRHTSP